MTIGSPVECRDLVKSFGPVTALRGASLTLTPHTLTALLGPSGCGKTTLLRVVAGFERADAGTVRVGERTVEGPGVHLPPERRHITIVPQEQALFPHLTVAENVGYGMRRRRGRSRRPTEPDTTRGVENMLEVAGLAGLGARMPNELSGGQQQRVALARALAPEPSVVLLDEPFGSLDAALRVEIQAEVATILRTTGATALLVTHDQEEALSMADTVAVMRDGRIVQHAPPDEVYRRPADLWVAGFVGSANLLPGRMTGAARVVCVLGELPVAAGSPNTNGQGDAVSVVVRPEQVRLGAAEGDAVGIVEHRQYFGHDALVRVGLPDGSHVVARTGSAEPLPAGARVSVRCDGEVVCFPAA